MAGFEANHISCEKLNLLDVVNFVYGVIGTEDPQLLLHPVEDQSLPELQSKGSYHLHQVLRVNLADHLHVVERVRDPVLRDRAHQVEGVRLWANLHFLDVGHKGCLPVDPRVGHLVLESSELIVNAHAALLNYMVTVDEDANDDGVS